MTGTDGFIRVPNWLLDDSDLTLHEFAVYVALLRFRDSKTGKCFPGMTTIADRARVSRETVKRTIPKLVDKGLITVTKRREGVKNLPNVYTVAVAKETPQNLIANSKRGQRVPKRSKNSECLPASEKPKGGHSQTLGGHSQTPLVGTPSAPNKTYKNKTHEQAMTPTFVESGSNPLFTFTTPQPNLATEKQIKLLHDLATQLQYGAGGGLPKASQLERWRKLTTEQATEQIKGYYKAIGRPDEIEYPEYGTPEYAALSPQGQAFADSAGQPESVI